MACDLKALEAQVLECYRRQDWSAALVLLERSISDPDVIVRGWAKMYAAGLLYKQFPTMAITGLRHATEAIVLLAGAPGYRMFAHIQAIALCLYLDEMNTGLDVARSSLDLLASGAAEVLPWGGRAWLGKAQLKRRLAEQADDERRKDDAQKYRRQALALAERSMMASEQHGSPWSERDKLCQIRNANLLVADVHWIAGREGQAIGIVDSLMSELAQDDPASFHFWNGRIADRAGKDSDAVASLRMALMECASATTRDHLYLNRIAVELGDVFARMGEYEALRQLVSPILREAAAVCNAGLVWRLQQMLRRVGRELREATR